jgi:hypothetical protein
VLLLNVLIGRVRVWRERVDGGALGAARAAAA